MDMAGKVLVGTCALVALVVLVILLTDGRYFGKGLVYWLYDRFGPAIFSARSDAQTWYLLAERVALSGTERILDVGTAMADLPLTLAGAGMVAQAIGVDRSAPMMAAARAVARGRGVGDSVSFAVADLTQGMPFAGGQMDVIFCFGVLEAVPRPEAALAELRRLLRPGGVVVTSVYRGAATLGASLSVNWYRERMEGGQVELVPLRRSHDAALLRFPDLN